MGVSDAPVLSLQTLPAACKELWQPWNSSLHLSLVCLSALVGSLTRPWYGLGFYILLSVANEVSAGVFRKTLVDASETIAHGYNYSRWLDDSGSATGHGLDYGFNFYDGDYTKTPRQAQLAKFEFAYQQLGLEAGMSVLDIGCGCGDWLFWLKTEKDIHVQGVNITQAQVELCRSRGLDVIHSDWKAISASPAHREKLYLKFDVVTFWDTVEHYCHSYHSSAQCDKVYRDMFKLVLSCLKPASPLRRVWISCLHLNLTRSQMSTISLKNIKALYCYWLLDKFHSGNYPSAINDQLVSNAATCGFVLDGRRDLTLDYYKTSVLNPTHFGRFRFRVTGAKLGYLLANAFLDPHWLPRLLWFANEGWMDQFEPENLDKSLVRLWFLWLQAPAQ